MVMPRLSLVARRRVATLFEKGLGIRDIQRHLEKENFVITRNTLYQLMQNLNKVKLVHMHQHTVVKQIRISVN